MRTTGKYLISAALLALATALAPSPAAACGGTFCDGGGSNPGQVMPIDQRGENILFVFGEGYVEAHIQIQYEGEAPNFAWVIPVRGIPSFSIGSQALFNRLLGATVPSYGYSSFGCLLPGATPVSGGQGAAPVGSLLSEAAVGAYQISIITGDSGDEVHEWLTQKGYAPNPEAPAILQEYLQNGYRFVALKLQNGVGVDQIHPIVIRTPGQEPCVPLKLTRIAAVEDMTVRTFFLGDERVVPLNYKHVTLNPLRLNWLQFANNYDDVVSHAVDSPVANGRAFVTEYAGPSSIATLPVPPWDPSRFAQIAPEKVVHELNSQGLASCYQQACKWMHPLLAPLLRQFLPPPEGVEEEQFYGDLPYYKQLINPDAWDPIAFASAFDERIFLPAKHASDVVAKHPYLTRMVTRISPAEMTEDPEFAQKPGLPSITKLSNQVTSTIASCGQCPRVSVPNTQTSGGVPLSVPVRIGWPQWGDDMPWAEQIEDMSVEGPPITLVDNRIDINERLAKYSQSQICNAQTSTNQPPGSTQKSSCSCPAGQYVDNRYGSECHCTSYPGLSDEGGGCACAVGPSPKALSPWGLAALALAGLCARRRRISGAALLRGAKALAPLAVALTAACGSGGDSAESDGFASPAAAPGKQGGQGGIKGGSSAGSGGSGTNIGNGGQGQAAGQSSQGAGGGAAGFGNPGAAGKGGGHPGTAGKAGSGGQPGGSGQNSGGKAGAAGQPAGGSGGASGAQGGAGGAGQAGAGAGGAGAGGAGAGGANACDGLDPDKPITLYQSSDDSNSMASPVILRRELMLGLPLRPELVRPHEFLNYYRFDYQPAEPGHVRVVPEMRQDAEGALHLQIAIQAPAAVKPRRSMNLTLVLDTSGSMDQDGRMERLRAVLGAVAAQLAAGDRISLLTWSDEQTIMLDSLEVAGPSDPELLANLEAIQLNGGSNLNAGLTAGYEIAGKNYEKTRMNRVLVISDGEANVGVTSGDLIGKASHAADDEGIYLVGVNVGSESGDSLMNIVTDKGRGASLFLDTVEEAERMFGPRFDETMEIAARGVRLELTVPWYVALEKFSGEQSSTDASKVDPQHLSPDDAMVFNEVFRACNTKLIKPTDVIKAKATWQTPLTHEPREDEVSTTLGELLEAPAPHLAKGSAIYDYAQLLRQVGSVPSWKTKARLGEVLARVKKINKSGDKDLEEIEMLLLKLDERIPDDGGPEAGGAGGEGQGGEGGASGAGAAGEAGKAGAGGEAATPGSFCLAGKSCTGMCTVPISADCKLKCECGGGGSITCQGAVYCGVALSEPPCGCAAGAYCEIANGPECHFPCSCGEDGTMRCDKTACD